MRCDPLMKYPVVIFEADPSLRSQLSALPAAMFTRDLEGSGPAGITRRVGLLVGWEAQNYPHR